MRRIVTLVVAEAGAVWGLLAHRGALTGPAGAPDDLLAVAAWGLALAVAVWLLASTLACAAVAHAPAVPAGARRAVHALALPAVRRATAGAAALSVVGALALPATAQAGVVRTGRAAPAVQPTAGELAERAEPVLLGTDLDLDLDDLDGLDELDGLDDQDSQVHRVAPGEDLWAIATARVRAESPDAGDERIAPYWAALVEHNRSVVASGDPGVIHPGEELHLPPLDLPLAQPLAQPLARPPADPSTEPGG